MCCIIVIIIIITTVILGGRLRGQGLRVEEGGLDRGRLLIVVVMHE